MSLKEGKDALAHRQKLIRVADRSELGWALVAEYEADSLAVDSDDEKRLERAERTVERKVAAKRRKSEEVEKARKVARKVHEADVQIDAGTNLMVNKEGCGNNTMYGM